MRISWNAQSSRKAGRIELLVAVTVLAIATGMATVVTSALVPSMRVDAEARRLIALLHYGREASIATRRNIRVRFDVRSNSATLVRMDARLETPLDTLVLEHNVRFLQVPGLGDTPKAFGAEAAVDFGDSDDLIFEPDGSLSDETGLPVNGTIFLAIDEQLQSARAITVMGTTVRAQRYRWSGGTAGSGEWSGQ